MVRRATAHTDAMAACGAYEDLTSSRSIPFLSLFSSYCHF